MALPDANRDTAQVRPIRLPVCHEALIAQRTWVIQENENGDDSSLSHQMNGNRALMTFFNKVIANESKNRMSMWNISTVMAPNLFFSRSKHSDYEELLLANTAAHIIRLMLKYQKILWKVSDIVMTGPPQKSMAPGNIKAP
ncbi:Rho GTPase-activating protein 28 [Saguinus oedipus]|uniref:Rho GTPase-activating protein 28 n=1 Tax=Saguinus oedipus TaxID=9490 RepID=A0ABQ9UC40_SAGOE|nr:Rho GTPase-activating protein 28 [Saguinus oedipus]